MKSPSSLAEVSEQTAAGRPFHLSLGEYLDRFAASPSSEGFQSEPRPLRNSQPGLGLVYDAYLASTAESLALQLGVPGPEWAKAPSRALHRPWFASTLGSLRALLILESPAPFRARNLFVSADALSRA